MWSAVVTVHDCWRQCLTVESLLRVQKKKTTNLSSQVDFFHPVISTCLPSMCHSAQCSSSSLKPPDE